MTISRRFAFPFFVGGDAALSDSRRTAYDVVINGRGYMIDFNSPYKFESIPLLRNLYLQERSSGPIGETALNPDDYWRRSVDDWTNGAGQTWADHADSSNTRFESCKGVDVWTKGTVTLLHDIDTTLAVWDDALATVVGTELYYWAKLGAVESLVRHPANDFSPHGIVADATDSALSGVTSITTDGYTLWVADTHRVHYTTRGSNTYLPWHTVDAPNRLVRSAKSRLFTISGGTIYTNTMTPGTSAETSYVVHDNPDWRWTDVVGGPDAVYFAGYAGTHSAIYAATLKDDATALDPPVVVATLPAGEVVRSLVCYLNLMVIGTDKGWRIASLAAGGVSLTLGALVTMDNPPTCFEPQDRFVWYGWTNYDGQSTGLGRMDLSAFNDTTPAYASDLMYPGQGAVTSVCTWNGLRVFTVTGFGPIVETTNFVTQGEIVSGRFDYTLSDAKVAIKCNVQYRKGAGTIVLSVAPDDDDFQDVGIPITTAAARGDSSTIQLPQMVAHAYNLRFTLTRGSPTQAPTLDRHTLMVEPQPERRFLITVPLMLHDSVTLRNNLRTSYNPYAERAVYKNLISSAQVVPFQDVEGKTDVIVEDMSWVPYEVKLPDRVWNGTLTVVLKVID